jgi:hypothetical protein
MKINNNSNKNSDNNKDNNSNNNNNNNDDDNSVFAVRWKVHYFVDVTTSRAVTRLGYIE